MFRRLVRMVVWLTVVTAAAVVVAKLISSRRPPPPGADVGPWSPLDTARRPEPEVAEPVPAGAAPAEAGPVPAVETEAVWVEPDGDACPTGYPVKAKMSSGIYHVPGGANYDRTRPDRCYASAQAAETDGLRLAKR